MFLPVKMTLSLDVERYIYFRDFDAFFVARTQCSLDGKVCSKTFRILLIPDFCGEIFKLLVRDFGKRIPAFLIKYQLDSVFEQ